MIKNNNLQKKFNYFYFCTLIMQIPPTSTPELPKDQSKDKVGQNISKLITELNKKKEEIVTQKIEIKNLQEMNDGLKENIIKQNKTIIGNILI